MHTSQNHSKYKRFPAFKISDTEPVPNVTKNEHTKKDHTPF